MKKFSQNIKTSDITPEHIYQSRRDFIKKLGFGLGLTITQSSLALNALNFKSYDSNLKEKLTPEKDITSYNNYYEFGTSKNDPKENAYRLITEPWSISIEGEVKRPMILSVDDILKLSPLEERVYRLRCVEGWSMVIPWIGIPLNKLISKISLTNNAKFVEFVSLKRPAEMIGQKDDILDWPYTEGLRIDEAMHPLAFLAVGLYGKVLPNQNGAPIRLVVPWKYGFKSTKAIVKLRLTEFMPKTSWMKSNPNEYGFYSNVNPIVDHPRWSQLTERRIGESLLSPRLKTEIFNGYGKEVASMYQGMDLKKYF